MTRTHKDLPGGSQTWATEVDEYKARVEQLEGIVRRMVNDFGLDYSNPARGLNTGNTPSVQNPVQLKLPSLHDLDIRDAVDGDLLTFDGRRGMWVARKHNTVQLPKVFEQGDPASYYHPQVPPSIIPADTWTATKAVQNLLTDPALTTTQTGMMSSPTWTVFDPGDGFNLGVSKDVVGISNAGGHLEVDINFTSADSDGTNYIAFDLPLGVKQFFGQATLRDLVVPAGAPQPDLLPSVQQAIYYYQTADTTGPLTGKNEFRSTELSQTSLDWVNLSQAVGFGTNGTSDGSVRVRGVLCIIMPWRGGSGKFLLDNLFAGSGDTPPYNVYFDGSTPDTTEVRFDWDGTANASTSTATTLQRLKYPANVPAGATFQVLGEGFLPGASVVVETGPNGAGGYYSQTVTPTAAGTFETTFTLASTDAVGTGYLDTYYEASSSFNYSPSTNYNITAS